MHYYEIFSILNDSTLFNTLLTTALYAIPTYIMFCIVVGGLHDICQQRKAHRNRINNIPYMKWNELRRFARENNIKVSRGTNKLMLQNLLIMQLS